MSTSIRTKALTGAAVALLTLGMAACTNTTDPAPSPSVEPAPVGPSDTGGGEATTSSPSEDPAVAAGECTLPAGDQSLPNQAPDVDEWVAVQGLGVPTSETYGPQYRDGDLFTCYAQSPTGALFASTYVVAASGRVEGFADNWVKDGEIAGADAGEGEPAQEEGSTTLRGYRFVAASSEEATVDIAVEFALPEGTALQAMRVILKWEEDRWVLSPEMANPSVTTLETMDGFTPWSTNG